MWNRDRFWTAENMEIGLIKYLAGIGRYTIRFHGQTADSTAPMDNRKDALVAAARFITMFDEQIKALGTGCDRHGGQAGYHAELQSVCTGAGGRKD